MTSHSNEPSTADENAETIRLWHEANHEGTMTNHRFNELLAGPLTHPLPMFTIARLTHALHSVTMATGRVGAEALEEWCRAREERDHND